MEERRTLNGFYMIFEIKNIHDTFSPDIFPIEKKEGSLDLLIDIFEFEENRLILDVFVAKSRLYEIVEKGKIIKTISELLQVDENEINLLSIEFEGFKLKMK